MAKLKYTDFGILSVWIIKAKQALGIKFLFVTHFLYVNLKFNIYMATGHWFVNFIKINFFQVYRLLNECYSSTEWCSSIQNVIFKLTAVLYLIKVLVFLKCNLSMLLALVIFLISKCITIKWKNDSLPV